jgi:hypothetical protein
MPRLTRNLLLAGILPLPWFLLWTSLGGWLLPPYSAISQHGSELLSAGGAPALCLRIAAIGSGLAFVLFAIGVWRCASAAFSLGAVAWSLFGLSMVSNGLWPMGDPMHGLYGVGMAALIAPAMSHIDLSAWLKQRWHYPLTAAVSALGILYLWLNLTGSDPQAYRGATQRLFSSINSLWPFAVSLSLLRGARSS